MTTMNFDHDHDHSNNSATTQDGTDNHGGDRDREGYDSGKGYKNDEWGAETTKMDPNNARRVVWALGEFLFFFFMFFCTK
jgi:hypothetical protein